MSLSCSHCFTWHNPTAQIEERLTTIGASPICRYLVWGREVCPTTGRQHLQGYVVWTSRRRFSAVRTQLAPAHVQAARGSSVQNRDYCTKDEDFVEIGTVPDDVGQGKRSDIDMFVLWLREYDGWPSSKDIMLSFPSLWMRYRDRCLDFREEICTPPPLQDGALNEWQSALAEKIDVEPEDDRKIDFYVDPLGGSGKSWFIRKMLTVRDDVQMLSIGKRDDLAYAIDETKRVFLISIPRGQMEFLNYSVLEMLKDRLVFSTKYQSTTKRLNSNPHVVVLSNEAPDFAKLTDDRYEVTHLSE